MDSFGESSFSSSADDNTRRNPNIDSISGHHSSPDSIDISLNAVEDQLTSISLSVGVVNGDCSSKSQEDGDGGGGICQNIGEFSSGGGFSCHDPTVRNGSELELDGQCSPSSSGYAGERGSSMGTSVSEIVGDNEITEFGEGATGMKSLLNHDNRFKREDDTSISWRTRKKHFFILSNSGKPIYSRYGDEHKLAGFTATLQAIISFVEDGGDNIKFVKAGKHQVVFIVKGPVYLVCISCTEEPHEWLQEQLEFIYGQMVLILTMSVNRCFEKNPKFDMTPLLEELIPYFRLSFILLAGTLLHFFMHTLVYTSLILLGRLRHQYYKMLQIRVYCSQY